VLLAPSPELEDGSPDDASSEVLLAPSPELEDGSPDDESSEVLLAPSPELEDGSPDDGSSVVLLDCPLEGRALVENWLDVPDAVDAEPRLVAPAEDGRVLVATVDDGSVMAEEEVAGVPLVDGRESLPVLDDDKEVGRPDEVVTDREVLEDPGETDASCGSSWGGAVHAARSARARAARVARGEGASMVRPPGRGGVGEGKASQPDHLSALSWGWSHGHGFPDGTGHWHMGGSS
jgi:hypothetical protein